MLLLCVCEFFLTDWKRSNFFETSLGSIDALYSTTLRTSNDVDSIVYLLFFVSVGGNSRQFFHYVFRFFSNVLKDSL